MKQKTAKRMLALLICTGLSIPAMATVVLDWSAANAMSTATGDIGLSVGTGTDQVGTGGWIRNFTPASPIMSSGVSAEYTGQNIYGVIQTSSANGSSVDLDPNGSRMDQSTPGLWVGVDGNNPDNGGADTRSIAGLVWYDLDSVPAASDHLSAMSLSVFANGGISSAKVRFAVQSAGNWYVSSESLDEAAFSGGTNTLSYAGANWAQLAVADASSTALMSAEGLSYNVAGTSLDNISAVGFFEEGGVVASTARARVKMATLSAEVIPEPATLGLIAAFGGGILMIRRRFMM